MAPNNDGGAASGGQGGETGKTGQSDRAGREFEESTTKLRHPLGDSLASDTTTTMGSKAGSKMDLLADADWGMDDIDDAMDEYILASIEDRPPTAPGGGVHDTGIEQYEGVHVEGTPPPTFTPAAMHDPSGVRSPHRHYQLLHNHDRDHDRDLNYDHVQHDRQATSPPSSSSSSSFSSSSSTFDDVDNLLGGLEDVDNMLEAYLHGESNAAAYVTPRKDDSWRFGDGDIT